jgi:hypothetical protein
MNWHRPDSNRPRRSITSITSTSLPFTISPGLQASMKPPSPREEPSYPDTPLRLYYLLDISQ